MKKLPNALVNTWLFLAIDKNEENRQASKVATNNLINVFGSINAAQVYLNNNKKDKAEPLLEEA